MATLQSPYKTSNIFQRRLSGYMWCDINGNTCFDYLTRYRLNGQNFLQFLNEYASVLSDEVQLINRING